MDRDAYLTVKEVAAELGVTESNVYRLIRLGTLPATRRSAHGTRVRRRVLDAYVTRLQPGRARRSATPTTTPETIEAQFERLLAAFIERTGVTPEAWEQSWQLGEIAVSDESFTRRVEALGLISAARLLNQSAAVSM